MEKEIKSINAMRKTQPNIIWNYATVSTLLLTGCISEYWRSICSLLDGLFSQSEALSGFPSYAAKRGWKQTRAKSPCAASMCTRPCVRVHVFWTNNALRYRKVWDVSTREETGLCVRYKYEMNKTFAVILHLMARVGYSVFVLLENENDGTAASLAYDGKVRL